MSFLSIVNNLKNQILQARNNAGNIVKQDIVQPTQNLLSKFNPPKQQPQNIPDVNVNGQMVRGGTIKQAPAPNVLQRLTTVPQQLARGLFDKGNTSFNQPGNIAYNATNIVPSYINQTTNMLSQGFKTSRGGAGIFEPPKSTSGLNKTIGGLQIGGAIFNATPPGVEFNAAMALLRGKLQENNQKGQPGAKNVLQNALANFKSGDSFQIAKELNIKNPTLAAGVDLVAPLLIGSVKPNPEELTKLTTALEDIAKNKNPEEIFNLTKNIPLLKGLGKDARTQISQTLVDANTPEDVATVAKDFKFNKNVPSTPPLSNEAGGIEGTKSSITPENAQVATQTPVNPATNGVAPTITKDTQSYLEDLAKQQKAAKVVEKGGILSRVGNFINDVKRKLVDSTAPIEDILYKEKKVGLKLKPSEDITNQIDRVYRSRQLAGQFAKDNGLVDVIKNVPDINHLDQYLIAQHAGEVATETGRNAAKDAQLVKELAPVYQPYADQIVKYGQKLLDYAVETGLVSKETADALKVKYPNYVPLNRIFNELEQGTVKGTGAGVASLSKQTIIQKLVGSGRAIANPTESLLTKTLDAFSQGERNVAGKLLASYKDLSSFKGLITELKPGESVPHTFSFIENGVKRTFETTPEIEQAAKLLDKQQMGFIGKIFAFPVRIARVGITGINLPFIASNLAKDQVSAFINSDKALQTSIANPKVFGQALWEAIGHSKQYDEWIRSAGGGTSFDISRNAPETTISKLRSSRNLISNIGYKLLHPEEILRSIEDVVARSEEMTRLQQFIGTKDNLIKNGMSEAEANIAAAKQSREATVNFARSGDWGKALNSVFLYVNAGIQGSRTLVRNLANRPLQTAAKLGLVVFTPLATVTAWNLSDPQRKAAYDDIREFEKENNLIIIPPNPTKDPTTGKWNVIKIPFSQEVANLTVPVRKSIEGMYGYDYPGFLDVTKSLIGSSTSLNVQNSGQLVGQFTPQAVKPGMESYLNKNLFTGQDIVPQYINGVPSKNLPPEMQVQPDTSGTARIIGKLLNTSPLKVEQFGKSTFGGLFSQVENASDTGLNKLGVIPKSQIGGQSTLQGITSRFNQATGGEVQNKLYNKVDQVSQGKSTQTYNDNLKAQEIFNQMENLAPSERQSFYNGLVQNKVVNKQIENKLKSLIADRQAGQQSMLLNQSNAVRAQIIFDEFKNKTPQERQAIYDSYRAKGITSKGVDDELVKLINNQKKNK